MSSTDARLIEGTPVQSTATAVATPRQSLKRTALRGAAWVAASQFLGQGLRMASNVILTRLLRPELFGMMALVNATLRGLKMFSDFGLNASVIRNQRGEEQAFLDTAWTLQIVRGVVLFAAACALAWPLSIINDEPALFALLTVASVTVLISGFDSTRVFALNRRLEMGKLTALDLSQQVVGIVVMIAWAWISPTVWALVAGGIVSTTFRAVLSNVMLARPVHRPAWDRDALRELVSFGAWVFIATAMSFSANFADQFILAALIGFQWLGVFTIARYIAEVPRDLVGVLSRRVALPAVSSRLSLPRSELRDLLTRYRRQALLLMAALVAVLVAVSDQLIYILYDPRYEAAAWMLPLLAVGLWPRILTDSINPALMAVGKPQWNTLGSVLRLVTVAAGLPVGYGLIGTPGAVAVLAMADLPNYVAMSMGASRERVLNPAQDLLMTLAFLGLLGALLAVRLAVGLGLPFAAGY